MRSIRYEYDIIVGNNTKRVIKTKPTREEAREFKRELDAEYPDHRHKIVQHRYLLTESKAVR